MHVVRRQASTRPEDSKSRDAILGRSGRTLASSRMSPLPLRAALTQGALVTAANWPVVLIDFVLDLFLKLTLTVPVIGGAVMVATLVETDLQTVLAEGLRSTADLVIGSLVSTPIALTSFLAAVAIVGLGGGPG